jgi:hypothetical protein
MTMVSIVGHLTTAIAPQKNSPDAALAENYYTRTRAFVR